MNTETASVEAQDEATSNKDFVLVFDKTATPMNPIRRHDVLLDDGTIATYEFKVGKWFKLPRAHGMRFARLKEGFEVKDADGQPIKPLEIPGEKDAKDGGASFHFAPGTCIARYEEMTAAALIVRANLVPGGLHFNAQNKKAELVKFLTENDEKKERERAAAKDSLDLSDADTLGGEMSEAELKALFKE